MASATVSIDQALNTLSQALREMPAAAREAVATNFAGWARDGGADHWRAGLQAMLSHSPRKQPLRVA